MTDPLFTTPPAGSLGITHFGTDDGRSRSVRIRSVLPSGEMLCEDVATGAVFRMQPNTIQPICANCGNPAGRHSSYKWRCPVGTTYFSFKIG